MKILVIEDEDSYRESLRLLLVRAGYEVLTAASGGAGIESAKTFQPDVVITDWMLKNHYHGGDVAAAVSQSSPDAKTIVITGYLDLIQEAGKDLDRVHEILEKPFRSEEILAAIQRALPPES